MGLHARAWGAGQECIYNYSRKMGGKSALKTSALMSHNTVETSEGINTHNFFQEHIVSDYFR
jgi:hypothetical protein